MLRVKTEEVKAKVKTILDNEYTSYWFPSDSDNGLHIDDFISYDEMAAIVDAIRCDERESVEQKPVISDAEIIEMAQHSLLQSIQRYNREHGCGLAKARRLVYKLIGKPLEH